jgi:hypothetical protein
MLGKPLLKRSLDKRLRTISSHYQPNFSLQTAQIQYHGVKYNPMREHLMKIGIQFRPKDGAVKHEH